MFDGGRVVHQRGVAGSQPGLYFVGLKYLYAPSSSNLNGVGRDAEYLVAAIDSRSVQPVTAGL